MNWKRSFFGLLAVVPLVGLLAYGMTRNPREIVSPLPGKAAPPFALTTFAAGDKPAFPVQVGDTVRLADHAGKIVVVNYWASWCTECRYEHRDLSETAAAYVERAPEVRFLGVLYNDKPNRGIEWISQMGGQSYPSVDDPGARAAIDYGVYGVPETFVIGKDGRVAYKHVGPITADVLKAKVDSLRAVPTPAGTDVPPTQRVGATP
ncbi:MAG: redoxin domain-containing protein [Gemmatimonadaceae bacterium]|nr:redoxin domain-containing protein [Gemmatimonadaceae bacterium]